MLNYVQTLYACQQTGLEGPSPFNILSAKNEIIKEQMLNQRQIVLSHIKWFHCGNHKKSKDTLSRLDRDIVKQEQYSGELNIELLGPILQLSIKRENWNK